MTLPEESLRHDSSSAPNASRQNSISLARFMADQHRNDHFGFHLHNGYRFVRGRWIGLLAADHSLDTISIRIEDECSEVIGTVFRMSSSRAIVLPTVGEGRIIKIDHRFTG